MKLGLCSYFHYIFLNYCFSDLPQEGVNIFREKDENLRFQVRYQWNYINYTWDSTQHYNWAIESKYYIPENNAPVGMKIYRNIMFLSVPRFRSGIPATLAYLDMHLWSESESPLLSPYPDWSTNDDTRCANLQSVQSMEIDTKGIMWVIDGVRINNYTRCPTKLVLFDLNNIGNIAHTYIFPNEICLQDGGFLNDIMIDESDGGFAYITENSAIDPGIIVYSRSKNRSWKLRDVSMFAEPNGNNFYVDNTVFDLAIPVDGIALSPRNENGERTLFFCAISAFRLYSVSTSVIQNQELVKTGKWRESVRSVGRKISQTDGLVIDNESNMYLTLLPLYGVAKWNIHNPLWTTKIIDQNRNTIIWPDGFAFDENGYLYVISNKVFNYIDLRKMPRINGDSQFRVLRVFTGTRSYLYG